MGPVDKLAGLSASSKRLALMVCDGVAMVAALWLAFIVRLGDFDPAENPLILLLCLGAVAVSLVSLRLLGVYAARSPPGACSRSSSPCPPPTHRERLAALSTVSELSVLKNSALPPDRGPVR